MDLQGKGGDFHCHSLDWCAALGLARRCGWISQGTSLSEELLNLYGVSPESWDGNYGSNDFQTVSNDDAVAFAAALESALPDYSEDEEYKVFLKRLITFCQAGEFNIG